MTRISTVIIRLTDEDLATKGGMHILAQMVSSYIGDQFDLDVAIRLEDERGGMISESVPLSAIPMVAEVVPDNIAGLIGN